MMLNEFELQYYARDRQQAFLQQAETWRLLDEANKFVAQCGNLLQRAWWAVQAAFMRREQVPAC